MRETRPVVDLYTVPVRAADPRAISLARRIAGWFVARDINGAGSVRYGYPAIGMRWKYQGYANPPQLFTGHNARRVAGGTYRGKPGAYPSTSSPNPAAASPLSAAMATVTQYQLGNGA